MEPIARRFSNFAVVESRGRISGLRYRTPINLFELDDDFLAALTYGPGADWVRNVVAAGGVIETRGRRYTISSAEFVSRATAWPHLPIIVRIALRLLGVQDFLQMEVTSQ